MKKFLPSCALALLLLGMPTPSPDAEDEPLEAWIRGYFEVCLNSPDLGCLDEYWIAPKAAGVRKSEDLRRSHFPDLRYEVREVLIDGDRVAVVARVTGRHGEASSGALKLDEVFLYTVPDRRITQGEVFSDRLTLSQALGYRVLAPGEGED